MDIKKVLENKRIVNILIIFLAGICAFVIGGGVIKKDKTLPNETAVMQFSEKELEKRLEEILSTIEGAGKVAVFVMPEDYGASEYAKDTKEISGENKTENEQETVMSGKTGNSEPVLVKKSAPKISGVIVTAKGAGNPTVRQNIHSAVEKALSLPSYKVEVVKMK